MTRKHVPSSGLKVEVTEGTNEAVAVDELVDDLLHGNIAGALRALHEPAPESEIFPEAPAAT
ncbi:hypothetical protein [Leucobacter sp. USHLN153]|uniref:hypothetical protein n=1 Tax=Leucobacter sp. USHLN153 TaxID=3081268 RepID=UPI0030196438